MGLGPGILIHIECSRTVTMYPELVMSNKYSTFDKSMVSKRLEHLIKSSLSFQILVGDLVLNSTLSGKCIGSLMVNNCDESFIENALGPLEI